MNVKQKDKPRISVIVPIYNVEKYIRKCLDSLKNQTMKEIEVICIDDGSTDNSGRIADEYAGTHGGVLFRVIHTNNKGLSAARNLGIDEARADWIMFVDSDDWVEPGFCEIPYKAAVENDADLVIFGAFEITNIGRKKRRYQTLPIGNVDKIAVYEYGGIVVWNKLYKYSLFDSIRFPTGRVFEDLAITHKLINAANGVFVIHKCLYYHTYRYKSISHVPIATYQKDRLIYTLERYHDLASYRYPEDKLIFSLCAGALGYLSVTKPKNNELYMKAVSILNNTKKIPNELSFRQKVAFIIWKIDKNIFFFICKILGRIE